MTESDLVNLGFKKVMVPNSESNNGYDYYYYELQLLPGLVLISTDSIDVRHNYWEVKNFDWMGARIKDRRSVQMLKNLSAEWLN